MKCECGNSLKNLKVKLLFILSFIFLHTSYAQIESIRIHGFVHDDKTDEVLVGTLITVQDSGVALSNKTGYFSTYFKNLT